MGQICVVERRVFADPIHHGLHHQPTLVSPRSISRALALDGWRLTWAAINATAWEID